MNNLTSLDKWITQQGLEGVVKINIAKSHKRYKAVESDDRQWRDMAKKKNLLLKMKRITHLLLAIKKRFVRKIVGNCICHIINLNLYSVIWFSSFYFLFITRDRLIGVFQISQIIEFPIGRKCRVQSEI